MWKGRHVAAACLLNRRSGTAVVVASVYSPTVQTLWEEFWEDIRLLYGVYPETQILIGSDFNVHLRADDRPNGGGGRDPGSSQFLDVIALLGMAEMGPADCQFTWRGPTSQSPLDRFLCSSELLAAFPLAEVSALPRPLSDHTPICWSSMVGSAKPTYFKLNRSWLRDEKLKRDILAWWVSRLSFGVASDKLVTKLKGLRHHVFELRRQIRTARTQAREIALARVQKLDAVEDMRRLTSKEEKVRKKNRDVVAKADLQLELDWRQRSRQLWLSTGDANIRFFHMAASGRRRQNCIQQVLVGDWALIDQSSIGLALADYFREFYRH